MKKQLYIKQASRGFVVCYKDGNVWRSYTRPVTRAEAIHTAERLIKISPQAFCEAIFDCGTSAKTKGAS